MCCLIIRMRIWSELPLQDYPAVAGKQFMLSSLDTRVRLTVPVAGHSAIEQRLGHVGSIGDLEQIPNDLAQTAGYVHLNALMTPRPMLMIYNTRDNCCFVADSVKPNTFDPVVPFYQQAGAADKLEYYANSDPGTHNYDQDNREQLYRFLNLHFFPSEKTRPFRDPFTRRSSHSRKTERTAA